MKKEIQTILDSQVGTNGKLHRIKLERLTKDDLKLIKNSTNFIKDVTLAERLFILNNNLVLQDTICPICNKNKRPFLNFLRGYQPSCSSKCGQLTDTAILNKKESLKTINYIEARKKQINSIIKKYESLEKFYEIRNKNTRDSCLEKYGVESTNQLKSVKFKKYKTFYTDYEKKTSSKKLLREKTLLENNPQKTLTEIYKEIAIKSTNTFKQRDPGYKKRKEKGIVTSLERYGVEYASQQDSFKEKVYNTNVKKGDWLNLTPKTRKVWKSYAKETRRFTGRNYNLYKNKIQIIIPLGYEGKTHIDHIISIKDGFRFKISSYFISHPSNLRVIPATQNLSKGGNSDFSLEKLKNRILNFKYNLNDKVLYFTKIAVLIGKTI